MSDSAYSEIHMFSYASQLLFRSYPKNLVVGETIQRPDSHVPRKFVFHAGLRDPTYFPSGHKDIISLQQLQVCNKGDSIKISWPCDEYGILVKVDGKVEIQIVSVVIYESCE